VAAAAACGLAISAYLTLVHAAGAPLVCSASGLVDCERVLSSPFGVIAGSAVPTSAAGLLWFAVSGAIGLGWLAAPEARRLAQAQLVWAAGGLAVVLGLVFVEIVVLGTICAWCTAAHGLVLLTFLLAITAPPVAVDPLLPPALRETLPGPGGKG
jgi:uncharacterized membrane protein